MGHGGHIEYLGSCPKVRGILGTNQRQKPVFRGQELFALKDEPYQRWVRVTCDPENPIPTVARRGDKAFDRLINGTHCYRYSSSYPRLMFIRDEMVIKENTHEQGQ